MFLNEEIIYIYLYIYISIYIYSGVGELVMFLFLFLPGNSLSQFSSHHPHALLNLLALLKTWLVGHQNFFALKNDVVHFVKFSPLY